MRWGKMIPSLTLFSLNFGNTQHVDRTLALAAAVELLAHGYVIS